MGIDSDLIRGHIDTIILKILFSGDKYGYEICKEVEERSNGTYELKQPTLYSCLKRLEDKGFISSYWEDSDIGGKRHYYKLTEEGKEEYNRNQQEWAKSRSIIDNLISDTTSVAEEPKTEAAETTEEILVSPTEEPIDISTIEESASDEDETSFEELSLASSEELAEESPIEDIDEEVTAEENATEEINSDDDDNYDIMSMLGHFPAEENEIQNNIEELESAQSILDSFDKKYTDIDEDIESDNAEIPTNQDDNKEIVEQPIFDTVTNNTEEPTFNFNDYLNSDESYFDSEEAKSPIKNYITPNIVIDGIEESEKEEIIEENNEPVEEETRQEPETMDSPLTPSYIRFDDEGNSHEINNTSYESDIYVDDSNIDYDEIYINPEENNSLEETSSSFMFDNNEEESTDNTFSSFTLQDEPSIDEDSESVDNIDEVDEIVTSYETTPAQQIPTQTFDNFTPKYTDEEYKQMLNQLEGVQDTTITSTTEQKIQMFNTENLNKNIAKDYADLKTSLAEEGFTVRPHQHHVKESKETKNYIQSNKIKMIQSWITFGFITCALAIMYLILDNAAVKMFEFGIKYFIIGIGVTLIIPAIYTIIYIFNPHKKHLAKFIPKVSYLLSILLTVQLLILVYCINLQLGFYSFTQEHYNHLLWIVPSIMSLYPIIQTCIYHALYNSKRFHI